MKANLKILITAFAISISGCTHLSKQEDSKLRQLCGSNDAWDRYKCFEGQLFSEATIKTASSTITGAAAGAAWMSLNALVSGKKIEEAAIMGAIGGALIGFSSSYIENINQEKLSKIQIVGKLNDDLSNDIHLVGKLVSASDEALGEQIESVNQMQRKYEIFNSERTPSSEIEHYSKFTTNKLYKLHDVVIARSSAIINTSKLCTNYNLAIANVASNNDERMEFVLYLKSKLEDCEMKVNSLETARKKLEDRLNYFENERKQNNLHLRITS
ncbi:MAG: hypothetical protein WC757_03830 [Candidatus Paceibacterota bacterium]